LPAPLCIQEDMLEHLIYLVLLSLWVSAWLGWSFQGEVRHFLFAYVFPSSWRAGFSRLEMLGVLRDEFDMFLAATSNAPAFVRGLLGCPRCMSAWISAAGLAPLLLLGVDVWVLPLLWAAAAWVGHGIFDHANR
jgi:hypothetical protein